MKVAFQFFSILVLFLAIGCSSSTEPNDDGGGTPNPPAGGTSLSCTASLASTPSSNQIPLSISASGGSGSYRITSITLSSQNATNISGTTTFSSSTSVTATYSSSVSSSSSGSVSIVDNSTQASTSCTFSTSGGTTPPSTGNSCTISLSQSFPSVNQDTVLTLSTSSGWGSGPFTFTSLNISGSAIVTSPLSTLSSTQATATVRFPNAGTQSILASVVDSRGEQRSCSTSVTVQGSSTTYPSCTLNYVTSGNTVVFTATSSTGQAVTFSSFSAGNGGTYSILSNPLTVTYSTSGYKSVTAVAYAGGVPCNGNGSFSGSFYFTLQPSYIYCTLSTSPSSSYAGSYVNLTATIPSGYGVSPVRITDIYFSSYTGISGYYTGDLTASLYFPYSGIYQLQVRVEDAAGSTAYCDTYQYVY